MDRIENGKFKIEFINEDKLPIIIKPKDGQSHFENLLDLIQEEKNALNELLYRYGGILFRGFDIANSTQFNTLMEKISDDTCCKYTGGASPRKRKDKNIYTSTELPPNYHLLLHNEMSYYQNHPKKICFYCEIPPKSGGETTIADGRKIYQDMHNWIKTTFENKHITYYRYLYQNEIILKIIKKFKSFHKTWMEAFETNDKNEVEKACKNYGIDPIWLKNEGLIIRSTAPAIVTHPVTSEKVWFNQAHIFNLTIRQLGLQRYLLLKLLYLDKEKTVSRATFSDGTKVTVKMINSILETLQKNTIYIKWQAKDFLLLDNFLIMHGRAPFKGPRSILVSMY